MSEDEWESPEAYESLVGRWSAALAPRVLDWARVPAGGALVLDAGAGPGALSVALAARGCRVVGVDLVRKYAAHARRIVPAARLVVADASRLPLASASVDAVASGLALPQLDDAVEAVQEWARVTRDGGLVCAYVWDAERGTAWLRAARDALDGATTSAPGWTDGTLAAIFRGGGLVDVATTRIAAEVAFPSFEAYWAPFLSGEGPLPERIAALAWDERAAMRSRLEARVGSAPRFEAAVWAARGVVTRGRTP